MFLALETERLYFRRYTTDDFPFLKGLLTDPKVVRFIGSGKTKTEDEADRFFQWIVSSYETEHATGLMLAVEKANDRPIGHVGIVPQKIEGRPVNEVGYWISREEWGKGFATEAASAFLHYGLETLNNRRLVSIIQPGNHASIKVAEKIGMCYECDLLYKGQPVSLYVCEKQRG